MVGDEEEDGVDDLEGEFGLQVDGRKDDPHYITESMPRRPMHTVPLGTRSPIIPSLEPEPPAAEAASTRPHFVITLDRAETTMSESPRRCRH